MNLGCTHGLHAGPAHGETGGSVRVFHFGLESADQPHCRQLKLMRTRVLYAIALRNCTAGAADAPLSIRNKDFLLIADLKQAPRTGI